MHLSSSFQWVRSDRQVRFGFYILERVLPGAAVRGAMCVCSRGRKKPSPEGRAVTYTAASTNRPGLGCSPFRDLMEARVPAFPLEAWPQRRTSLTPVSGVVNDTV